MVQTSGAGHGPGVVAQAALAIFLRVRRQSDARSGRPAGPGRTTALLRNEAGASAEGENAPAHTNRGRFHRNGTLLLWDPPARGVEDGIASFFTQPAKEPQRKRYPFYLEEDYGLAESVI